MKMNEPVSSGTGLFFGAKALGLSAIFSAGVLGACVIAAVDPPKTRWEMFARALAAGVGSLFFGPTLVKYLDYRSDWIDLATAPLLDIVEAVAPVYLIVGCLSWGVFGALATLGKILRTRGGQAIAERVPGLTVTTKTTVTQTPSAPMPLDGEH